MSIQAVAWALEQDLPARPKLVLVSIANHASHTDGYCWLKMDTIAAEASCSRRAVFNFIGDLIRNGYVRKALRRGDDGKQRANDYWIVLNREPAEWIKAGTETETEDGLDPADAEPAEPQDVADRMHAVHPAETVDAPVGNEVQSAHGAPGPHAPACTHIDIAEPSKTNPKKSEPGVGTQAAQRRYRPPAPQPIGTVVEQPVRQIFVHVGTRAWDAWCDYHKRKTGVRWTLQRSAFVDGKSQTGWWFPSLFPPDVSRGDTGSTGPPATAA